MDREAWCAVIHGVAKTWTRLSNWIELNWTELNWRWYMKGTWYVKDDNDVWREILCEKQVKCLTCSICSINDGWYCHLIRFLLHLRRVSKEGKMFFESSKKTPRPWGMRESWRELQLFTSYSSEPPNSDLIDSQIFKNIISINANWINIFYCLIFGLCWVFAVAWAFL